MTAEDLQNKLNNIDGISNIKVTNGDVEGKAAEAAVQATQTLSGISTSVAGMDLTIAGLANPVAVAQNATNQDIADAINAEIAATETATAGSTTGMKAELDEDGNVLVTGKNDGTQLDITADFAANATGDTITIGGTPVAGAVAAVSGQEVTTNGAAAVDEVAGTFDIDLSNAKFDVGIETYNLNGAGDGSC